MIEDISTLNKNLENFALGFIGPDISDKTIKKESLAPKAAGKIHTDFEK